MYSYVNTDVAYKFTGQEFDDETGLHNFRARLYDAELGMFYAYDPAAQGFSPFGYCGNNPVIFVDENGQWFGIDDLIAAAIGGVVNLTVNLIQGNVNNFWEGLGYFGAGAAAGDLALYGPAGWAAGGAILGASNSALGGAQGWDILKGAGIGLVSGVAGGYAGQWAAKSLGGAIINGFQIGSPVVKGVIGGTIGGAVGGYAGGFTGGLLTTGDISMANQIGLNGLWTGAGIGGVVGGVSGYRYARENDLNPWSGRPDKSAVIGRGMKESVNPAAEISGSETITNDWNARFGNGYVDDAVGVRFNEQWMGSKVESKYWIYNIGKGNYNSIGLYYGAELNIINNYPHVYNAYFWKGGNTIFYWGR